MRRKLNLVKILFLIGIVCATYTASSSIAEEITLSTIMPGQVVGATIDVGTYTGNEDSTHITQTIDVGFEPVAVFVMAHDSDADHMPFVCRTNHMDANYSKEAHGAYVDTDILEFTSTGFIVGANMSVNQKDTVYSYIAIKTNQ